VHGKSVILTVVDRFSKYAHFIPLGHPYTVASVAKAFFNDIVRLHGLPESIVSDRDPVFTGHVWRDLFRMSGVSLKMSTAFYPQTDGQSEVVNKTISMYLRCVPGDRPRSWLDWLPWAEFCYNTSYHSALKTTPFHVVYGRAAPSIPHYQLGSTRTDTVDAMLADRDEFLNEVRTRLTQAQDYARRYYDAQHHDLEFKTGDWVWLRILHHPTHSLVPGPHNNLSPKYAGPFQVKNVWAQWPIGWSCQPVPEFTMFSKLDCSSHSKVHRHPRHLLYLLSTMGVSFYSQNVFLAQVSAAEVGTSSFSGQVCRRLMLHGNL
jgi:hypothetical protein